MNALPVTPDPSAPTPLPLDGWSRFVMARTSAEFCDAWLAVLRDKFAVIAQAAILVESSDGQNYVPIAVFPQANSDMARMGEAVQRALSERRVVVQPCAEPAGLWHVAAPLLVHERIAGSVVLELSAHDDTLPLLLRELHWGSAWLSNLFARREHDAALAASVRSLGVLEAIAIALRHERFQQALFDLSNELRRRFNGTRAAIGLMRHGEVKLAALSEAATFEKSSPLVHAYAAAMNEACDLAQTVEAAAPEHDAPDSFRAHTALLQRTGAGRLFTLPITQQARCVAVLTIEREAPAPFGEDERKWLETFGALLAPVIVQRVDAERGSWQRLRDEARRFLAAVMGPRYLLWKAGTLAVTLLLALLVLLPVPYRVSAKTVTEGEIQRVAAAPFEGFLSASFVRAGDTVAKGQPLAQLDDHELRVERAKWASERDQYDNKLREAMAGHDLTAMQVVGAQLREAQAQGPRALRRRGSDRRSQPADRHAGGSRQETVRDRAAAQLPHHPAGGRARDRPGARRPERPAGDHRPGRRADAVHRGQDHAGGHRAGRPQLLSRRSAPATGFAAAAAGHGRRRQDRRRPAQAWLGAAAWPVRLAAPESVELGPVAGGAQSVQSVLA